MVGCCNQNDVAGQAIHLKQQRIEHSLNFAGFLPVFTILCKSIKFVKKQHTLAKASVLKDFLNPFRRLA